MMAYTPTQWNPGGPPGISADKLNKLEQGLAAAAAVADAALPKSIPDTRSVPINPGDLQRKIQVDFKSGSTIGLSDAFYVVWTMRGWTDDSGGPATQIAYGPDGQWIRTGTQSGGWGPWRQLITSAGGQVINGTLGVSNGLYGTNAKLWVGDYKYGLGSFNSILWLVSEHGELHAADYLGNDKGRIWAEDRLRWNPAGFLEYNDGGTWRPVGTPTIIPSSTVQYSQPTEMSINASSFDYTLVGKFIPKGIGEALISADIRVSNTDSESLSLYFYTPVKFADAPPIKFDWNTPLGTRIYDNNNYFFNQGRMSYVLSGGNVTSYTTFTGSVHITAKIPIYIFARVNGGDDGGGTGWVKNIQIKYDMVG